MSQGRLEMNRQSCDRRRALRPGARDRRGGKVTRLVPNKEKAKRVRLGRKFWKLGRKEGGKLG